MSKDEHTFLPEAVWPPDVIRIIMCHFAERHRVHPSFSYYQWQKRKRMGWLCVLEELEDTFDVIRRYCNEEGSSNVFYHYFLKYNLIHIRERLSGSLQ